MDIKNSDNNRVRKFKTPSHNTPNNILFEACSGKELRDKCPPRPCWVAFAFPFFTYFAIYCFPFESSQAK